LAEVVAGEEILDELVALAGRLVGEEGAGGLDGWHAAGDVEIDPAEELRIVGRRGRGDLRGGEPGVDQLVDLRGDLLRGARAIGPRGDRLKVHRGALLAGLLG